MGETPEVILGGGTKLQRPLLPSCSKREDDKRKPPRAGRVDPGHGHEQDGGDSEGDRGDGGRAQRPPDRRHRRVLLRRVPLDGQHWLRHQEQLEGVSGQLAETFPGRLLGQGVHTRRGSTWVSGEPPLVARRQNTPESSWESRPRGSESRSGTWTSGRWWTARSWTTTSRSTSPM